MKLLQSIALIGVVLAGNVRAESGASGSTVIVSVSTRQALLRAISAAKPGTEIRIAPGTYRGGITVNNLRGTKGKPIVLTAADAKKPPVIEGGNSCLHLTNPAYVELRHLVLTKGRANGLNIDDGGSFDTPAKHIVLRGLVVRDIGTGGNHDAIKLSGVDDFRVEDCTVERWGKKGSGIDMVGCHRGTISGCTFREGDKLFGNGVQAKGGSREITVRYCRFENAGGRAINIGGSTGLSYFRPKPQGYEARDIRVEDCTFLGSMAPIAFVGVDGATVQHNIFYRPRRWIMRILQENQDSQFAPCRNGRFTRNLIVFRSDEVSTTVNIGPKTAPRTFRFADNYWYCIDRPARTRSAVRLPTPESNGTYGQAPQFKNAKQGDLQLAPNSPARKFGPRLRTDSR